MYICAHESFSKVNNVEALGDIYIQLHMVMASPFQGFNSLPSNHRI